MKRLGALVIAVALVVGAVLIRRAIDDPGKGGTTGSSSGGSASLVCAPEVADACSGLADTRVTVEDPGVTAARLQSGGKLGADGWLVSDPWPALAGRTRTSATLASSPIVAVMRPERATRLAAACNGPVAWRCIGERAGQQWSTFGGDPTWGEFKVGHDGPDTTDGLLSLVAAADGWFGNSTYASNDFDDDAFRTWLTRLERSVRDSAPTTAIAPIDQFAATPAAYSVVTALEASVPTAATSPSFRILRLEPLVRADVVLVGDAGLFDLEAIRTRLSTTGWTRASTATTSGLPNTGVMVALRTLQASLTK